VLRSIRPRARRAELGAISCRHGCWAAILRPDANTAWDGLMMLSSTRKTMIRRSMILASTLASSPATASAQDLAAQQAPYCSELKRVAGLALTRERFASIAGAPREGNFLNTSLPLTGWKDCSLYGSATYTCDSPGVGTAEVAEKEQARTLHQIKACLGDGWAEAKDRSSSTHVVLHSVTWPVSITLSIDQTDKKEHVVRLILFPRRN
jgi:hypothetical protein